MDQNELSGIGVGAELARDMVGLNRVVLRAAFTKQRLRPMEPFLALSDAQARIKMLFCNGDVNELWLGAVADHATKLDQLISHLKLSRPACRVTEWGNDKYVVRNIIFE